MAEEVSSGRADEAAVEVKKCELCPGIIGDSDHQDGKCGFWARVKRAAVEANGGVTVWA